MILALILALLVGIGAGYFVGWRHGEQVGIGNGLVTGRAVGWDDHRRLMGVADEMDPPPVGGRSGAQSLSAWNPPGAVQPNPGRPFPPPPPKGAA